jgi:hypothetical protein
MFLLKNNMAILKQISDSLAYYQGWYGICPEHSENNCEDLPLIQGTFPTLTKKYPEILKIELISGNSQAALAYSGSMLDGPFLSYQQIQNLECGRAYRIILKKGTGEIDIPEFNYSTSDNNDEYRLSDQCVAPTPTSTPLPCCAEGKISIRPNEGSFNNVTCTGTVEGTLCFDELKNYQLPVSYLCSFEDEDFTKSGLKITVSAEITNSRFRFTKDDGKCYEVALFHKNAEGINIFQIIT